MLSVIIPTYNRVDILPRAIDSVFMQTIPDNLTGLELIVVDDGSTDSTSELMQSAYSKIEYIKQSNQGVSAARNHGLAEAKGEWIALLDSDDEWLPNKLVRQFELLQQTDLMVCHTEEQWVRNGIRVNQMKKHQKRGGWIFKDCLPLCAMSPSSIVLHRSVLDQVGLFDRNLPACEDYDLWLRISAQFEVAYVKQASIVKYGGHDDQLSRQFWGMDRFRVIALEKILNQRILNEKDEIAARAMLINKLTILLTGATKHQNHVLIKECKEKLCKWNLEEGNNEQYA